MKYITSLIVLSIFVVLISVSCAIYSTNLLQRNRSIFFEQNVNARSQSPGQGGAGAGAGGGAGAGAGAGVGSEFDLLLNFKNNFR